jgi:hypothetical protein
VSSNLAAPTSFLFRGECGLEHSPFLLLNRVPAVPSPLHSTVIAAFQSQGWKYKLVPDQEVVETWFEAHHTHLLVFAQTYAEAGLVSVVGNAAQRVPHSHRYVVAEMLMRLNANMNVGNLELSWDQGQVMFRCSNVFPPGTAGDARIIAGLVHNAVAEIDRLTPYLAELCRVSELELPLYSITDLLGREDLLPPVPQEPA